MAYLRGGRAADVGLGAVDFESTSQWIDSRLRSVWPAVIGANAKRGEDKRAMPNEIYFSSPSLQRKNASRRSMKFRVRWTAEIVAAEDETAPPVVTLVPEILPPS